MTGQQTRDFTPKSAGSAWRQFSVGLALSVVAFLTVLTGITIGGQSGGTYAGAPPHRTGSATVTSCTEHGPVSWRGFGVWTSCTAQFKWQDGQTETRAAPLEFFRPEEVGQTVAVRETLVSNNKGVTALALSRDLRGQNGGYVVAAVALFLASGFLGLGGLGGLAGFLLWATRSRS
jgi:hypothetical protein